MRRINKNITNEEKGKDERKEEYKKSERGSGGENKEKYNKKERKRGRMKRNIELVQRVEEARSF
jgi:hypothetical protein